LFPQSKKNSIRKQDLGFSSPDPCPRCGRQFEILKKEKVKGRAKLDRTQLPTFKKTVVGHDEVGNRIENESTIQRNIHPYKHISLLSHQTNVIFNDNGSDKFPTNPRLNPPRPNTNRTRSSAERFLEESMRYHSKVLHTMAKMIPKIYAKYPKAITILEDLAPHFKFMGDYWNSAVDNRYKRSMVEWNEIAKYANERTAKEASKKYYGIKPDGTKDYLHPLQIKKKINEMKDFNERFNEHLCGCLVAGMLLSNIIREDPELLQEHKKMLQECDDDINNQRKEEKEYAYYEITHYDHDLYEKQKEEREKGLRKSKPDGIIKCRIKESDIPLFSFVHK
jgi:hypothetical protein